MLSEIKSQARQALHSAMAEPATYSDGITEYPTAEQTAAGLSLTVRWHTKQKIVGERINNDVAILEGINRLVFSSEELVALGLTLQRGGIVTIPGYFKSFQLDMEEDSDGPINVYWSVVEIEYAA